MLGNESEQQEEDCYHGDEDASRDPRCQEEITCETKRSLPRSTRLCAAAVFVGLDISRDEVTTNVTRRVMDLAIPGTRRRGRPKKTWHQQMKEHMTGVGVTQDVALDRSGEGGQGRPPGDRPSR